MFDLTDEDFEPSARFTQFFPMPGGHLKFAIVYDDVSNLFWATAILAVDSQEDLGVWREARRARHFAVSGGKDRNAFRRLQKSDSRIKVKSVYLSYLWERRQVNVRHAR